MDPRDRKSNLPGQWNMNQGGLKFYSPAQLTSFGIACFVDPQRLGQGKLEVNDNPMKLPEPKE